MNWLGNEKKPWNSKSIKKMMLIIIVADLEQFTLKNNLVTYIEVFVELYH